MRSVGVVFEAEIHPATVDSGGGEVGAGAGIASVGRSRSRRKPSPPMWRAICRIWTIRDSVRRRCSRMWGGACGRV